MIIWTSQSSADVLRLSPCVNVKQIHADRSDWKTSMPLDLDTGIPDTKTEPIAARLAILTPPFLSLNTVERAFFVVSVFLVLAVFSRRCPIRMRTVLKYSCS